MINTSDFFKSSQLSHKTFTSFVRSNRFVVIHFWAAWNGYDEIIRKLLDSQIPEDLKLLLAFASFNTEAPEHHALCIDHKVLNLSFLALYRQGRLEDRIIGLQPLEVIVDRLKALVFYEK
jgi:thiol-disulfide isomerase/thioredoxin